jgi:hypothetical protein
MGSQKANEGAKRQMGCQKANGVPKGKWDAKKANGVPKGKLDAKKGKWAPKGKSAPMTFCQTELKGSSQDKICLGGWAIVTFGH